MPRVKSVACVLVDNREQQPYLFTDYGIETIPATLHTGDYSVAVRKGDELIRYDSEIAIERKTLDNFIGDISNKENRERFEDSVRRGSLMRYYSVIIEGSELDIIQKQYESQINPKSVLNTKLGWSIRYRVPIEFAVNRTNAEYWTYNLLMLFLKYKKEGRL